jgi:hypothetical protein
MSHWQRFLLSCLMAFAVSGCAEIPDPSEPPPGPPEFEQAYIDGCISGYDDAGRDGYRSMFRKDVEAFASDAAYKNGWDQGHAACYEDERRTPRMMLPGH